MLTISNWELLHIIKDFMAENGLAIEDFREEIHKKELQRYIKERVDSVSGYFQILKRIQIKKDGAWHLDFGDKK